MQTFLIWIWNFYKFETLEKCVNDQLNIKKLDFGYKMPDFKISNDVESYRYDTPGNLAIKLRI